MGQTQKKAPAFQRLLEPPLNLERVNSAVSNSFIDLLPRDNRSDKAQLKTGCCIDPQPDIFQPKQILELWRRDGR